MKRYLPLLLLCATACGHPDYTPGPPGVAGTTGPQGTPGVIGPTGASGTDGLNGQDGQPCTVTATPTGSQIACPDGSVISILNGTDATPVTPLQLCPGTPSYPSTFIEYALCVQGQLYGVYSANGGFLAVLPYGQYTSDGINSRCNFTVSADCVITY